MRFLFLLILLCAVPTLAQTVSPAPGSTVSNGQNPMVATFQTPLQSVRFMVDGQDFSAQARVQGNQVVLTPTYPMAPGLHQVQIEAVNVMGAPERASWAFTVAGAAQPGGGSLAPVSYVPAPGTTVDGQRPLLSAEFPENIAAARLTLDNQDFSNQVALTGNRASMTPQFDLSPGQHIGRFGATGVSGQAYQGTWLFNVRAMAAPTPPPFSNASGGLSNYNPPPGAQMPTARPFISADFPQPVNNSRLLIDGVDVSGQVQRMGNRISWTPAYDLQVGQHNVVADGVLPNGQVVAGNWTFYTQQGGGQTPTPVVALQILRPNPGSRVNRTFNIRVQAAPRALIRVTVRDLTTQRTKTYQGSAAGKGAFDLRIDAGWTLPISRLELTATAIDPANSQPIGQPVSITVSRI